MTPTASPAATAETASRGPTGAATLQAAFERVLAAYRREPMPTYGQRLQRLTRLEQEMQRRQDDIASAVCADYGNRSIHETRIAEVLMPLDQIRYIRRHLRSWMKPRPRRVSLTYQPASARVQYQPLGVVGIIAPWNYPVTLAVSPLAAALAAGNRVLVKPSELTPRTAELLSRMFAEIFGPDLVEVVTGGPEVGEAFSRLPLHHLLYTGSTHVGRMVMRAAAENLTPVTLELGGKSPAIVHESYPIRKAAGRIAWGKCTNAGQTCIAPDYLLAPTSRLEALVDAVRERVCASYPTLKDNGDYTCVINDRHYQRLRGLIEDAEARGARQVEINPAGETLGPQTRKIAPTLLLDVNDEMRVMQEEIFGPVLPIVGYRDLDDAITYVNDRPRPLALYYFDEDRARARHVLERTVSGGAAVNETLLQFGIDDMPFGGVGASGMGSYHGFEGFETFSHKKSVLRQRRINATGLLAPPYGKLIDRMLSTLIGSR